jgi:hypothetical protein
MRHQPSKNVEPSLIFSSSSNKSNAATPTDGGAMRRNNAGDPFSPTVLESLFGEARELGKQGGIKK